jgi:transglutaminase-like putative cysteine protease
MDALGNLVDFFSLDDPFQELVVTASSTVVVTEPALPSTDVTWETARDRLSADAVTGTAAAARFFCLDSPLVATSDAIRAYATRSFPSGRSLVEAVVDLTNRIAADFTYDPGFTTVTTPVDEVLHFRRGVCQDFAHLAVGCVRAMGLAARYVSGYLETSPPPGQARLIGADASHAWVSVFIPDWGWLDLDPTNNVVVGNTHAVTAWGRDYADVAPLTGTIVGGGISGTLDVAVDMSREKPVA